MPEASKRSEVLRKLVLARQRGGQEKASSFDLDEVARAFARGASFGGADEAAAAGDATIGYKFGRGSQAQTWQQRYP